MQSRFIVLFFFLFINLHASAKTEVESFSSSLETIHNKIKRSQKNRKFLYQDTLDRLSLTITNLELWGILAQTVRGQCIYLVKQKNPRLSLIVLNSYLDNYLPTFNWFEAARFTISEQLAKQQFIPPNKTLENLKTQFYVRIAEGAKNFFTREMRVMIEINQIGLEIQNEFNRMDSLPNTVPQLLLENALWSTMSVWAHHIDSLWPMWVQQLNVRIRKQLTNFTAFGDHFTLRLYEDPVFNWPHDTHSAPLPYLENAKQLWESAHAIARKGRRRHH